MRPNDPNRRAGCPGHPRFGPCGRACICGLARPFAIRFVIALVKELHDSLTNGSVSDTEACAVYLHTVAVLTVYAVREERRQCYVRLRPGYLASSGSLNRRVRTTVTVYRPN